jgi:hypothetical protein
LASTTAAAVDLPESSTHLASQPNDPAETDYPNKGAEVAIVSLLQLAPSRVLYTNFEFRIMSPSAMQTPSLTLTVKALLSPSCPLCETTITKTAVAIIPIILVYV